MVLTQRENLTEGQIMAFNPDEGVAASAFNPDEGVAAPAFRRGTVQTSRSGKTGHVDTLTTAPVAAPSTIQQMAPGQFNGEARVTAGPGAWDRAVSALGGVAEDIFPSVVAQARSGGSAPWAGIPGLAGSPGLPAWAGIRDAATLIPRMAAASGTALGEYAGNPDATILSALEQGANTLRDPVGATEAGIPGSTAARIGAGMANDPTTLPMAFMPAGRGVLGAIAAGGKMGAGTYASHVLDRYGLGGQSLPDALTGETLGQAAQDVLPIIAPPMLRYIQQGVGEVVSPLLKYMGKPGVEKARQIVTSIFKTAPQIKQGQTWEGLQKTLAGSINGEPIFPQIVTHETHNIPDVVKNYDALHASVNQGYDPTLDALGKEGIRVPARAIVDATENELNRLRVDPGEMKAWSPSDVAQANTFVRRSLMKHEGDAGKQALFDAATTGERNPDFYIAKNGLKIAPIKYAHGVRSGTIVPGQFEPAYSLPDGASVTKNELMNPILSPRGTQTAKSAMNEEAFKRTAEQSLAKESAARFAGKEARRYLVTPSLHPDITPQGVALMSDFEQLLKNSAPLEAGSDAMARAGRVTANRNPISLTKAQIGLNPIKALKIAAQEDPAYARQAYDYAMKTQQFEPLARLLMGSPLARGLGAKELPAIVAQSARSAIAQKGRTR
jgi:hypothetical protein